MDRPTLRAVALALALLLPLAACGDDDPTGPSDTVAPAAIGDLVLDARPDGSLWLQWTATGDDDTTGQATTYDLRYHTAPLVASNWHLGTALDSGPPAAPGSAEEIELGPRFTAGTWFFALRVADEEGNWSQPSIAVEISPSTRPYSVAVDEDQLVRNVVRAWNGGLLSDYSDLLDDGFQFWFSPADEDLVDGRFWTHADELEAAGRMLGGQPGIWPTQAPWPAIESMQLAATPRSEGWSDADLETVGGVTPIPDGARKRIYDLQLNVVLEDATVFTAVGSHTFYVVGEETQLGEQSVTEWKLLLWQDLGTDALKGAVDFTLGEFKVRYGDPPPIDTTGLATSEDELVSLFESAWAERDFQTYDTLLSEDFAFFFAPEDLDLAPNGYFWDRAADLASTERLFSGQVGQRPNGEPQPPVQSITIALTPDQPEWVEAGGENIAGVRPVPEGVRKRLYSVEMRVYYVAGEFISEVIGEQYFYVQPGEKVFDTGQTVPVWELWTWRDFGNVSRKAVEGTTWGTVKAYY